MLTFASLIHSRVEPLIEDNIDYALWVNNAALENIDFELSKEARSWIAKLRKIHNDFLVHNDDQVFKINEKDLPLYSSFKSQDPNEKINA